MLEWIARGLRRGVVTTSYPRRPDHAPDSFRGRVAVTEAGEAGTSLEDLCPTGAIRVRDAKVELDRGRCILCGACVEAAPERFRFDARYETASRRRQALIVGDRTSADIPEARPTLADRSRPLRGSVHIRHVDTGSDGSEEWEIAALANPYYDMQRLGLYFTPAPRHADILLVTGPAAPAMRRPLERAYEAMPEPKAVVAAGTDACSGGLCAVGEPALEGVDSILPVDVYVPGSPPSPIALLHGLLLAVGRLTEEVG
jgi:Ni,Fe-hydrogenase III small subunit/ferredoxin